MRGLKTSCRELNNASGLRIEQGSGQLNIRTSGRANVTFRFALVRIKPSCGNTGDSASELRAIDKRFDRTRGGAINKATIALKIRESLTLESPVSHKAGLESLVNAGKPYR